MYVVTGRVLPRTCLFSRSYVEVQPALLGMEIFAGTYMRRWLSPYVALGDTEKKAKSRFSGEFRRKWRLSIFVRV